MYGVCLSENSHSKISFHDKIADIRNLFLNRTKIPIRLKNVAETWRLIQISWYEITNRNIFQLRLKISSNWRQIKILEVRRECILCKSVQFFRRIKKNKLPILNIIIPQLYVTYLPDSFEFSTCVLIFGIFCLWNYFINQL